jgi:diguanylate cyclase (GGDEF)-like protein
MIDIVGRYGGEEFIVLLPETDLGGAEIVANRIVDTIRSAAIAHPGLGRQACVSASLGVACGPSPDGWKEVLDAADKALYCAKSDGRDRVVMAAPREAA